MKTFEAVIAELRFRQDCRFESATTLPQIPVDFALPADLAQFYGQFSEARLFSDDGYDPRCHILPPQKFVQVGSAICGEPTELAPERSWYSLAHVRDGNFIGIDLSPTRLGWCYDCFHETYGEPGYCKVIARSFTELLNQLLISKNEAFWLSKDFRGYGDAYDFFN
ncbi:MAG: SMI1/KNR4 family protein [Pirellulales bacterium]